MTSTIVEPFHFSLDPTRHGTFVRWLAARTESLLSFPALNGCYARASSYPAEQNFADRGLASIDLRYDVDPDDLNRLPKSGPAIVVANHPFGGIDGLILASLLRRVRPDARLLANFLLGRIPDMHELCFFVDPFGGPAATRRNIAAMKSALQWLREGHMLGVFPAGEVSHLTLQNRCITDPQWSETVARLAQRAKCPIVPVLFEGRNSRIFQLAGMLHPRLRTALLPRELLARRGTRVSLRIGNEIPPSKLDRFDEPRELSDYLRLRTYILKGRDGQRLSAPLKPPASGAYEPIVPAEPVDAIEREIAALPADALLVENGSQRVLFARADQIPATLREIGRLRELTFRAVGEGTGRSIDLDRFDRDYWHLFIWNAAEREIVGAYRMGPTDELLARGGVQALYTRTLWNYGPRLIERLGPSLELGRSFVTAANQKSYAPLMLLWKGLGHFCVRHPRYRYLFGPVSISDEYQSMTKQLLMAFLDSNEYRSEFAALVRSRRPPRFRPFRDCQSRALAAAVRDIGDVDELVNEIESERRHVPVLLRQYLRVNAKLLGFNIDPEFGDVLDGLVLVDLTSLDPSVIKRYFGVAGAASFLAHHARSARRDRDCVSAV